MATVKVRGRRRRSGPMAGKPHAVGEVRAAGVSRTSSERPGSKSFPRVCITSFKKFQYPSSATGGLASISLHVNDVFLSVPVPWLSGVLSRSSKALIIASAALTNSAGMTG
jgi:hypothetical protein